MCESAYACMIADTKRGTRMSRCDLIKRSHHHWRKKLSTYGENVTTANEDIAMTSTISIRDQDRVEGDGKGKLRQEVEGQKEKGRSRTGGVEFEQ